MRYSAPARLLPAVLRKQILHFEALIEDAVREFAQRLPDGVRVLDAGAGESQYAGWFRGRRYYGVDLGIGDASWNYRRLDAIADLAQLPFRNNAFAAALNIVTLEHVREPVCVLQELHRTLSPGGQLLLVVPHEWEVHQSPHDYFRYTRYGLQYLLKCAGFEVQELHPAGGYFRLLSRWLGTDYNFSQGERVGCRSCRQRCLWRPPP